MYRTKTIAILALTLLFGGLVLVGSAFAQKSEEIAPYLHAGFCDEITTTADTLTCLASHKKVAEARLKDVSALYMKQLDEEQLKLFEESEAAWVTFRDKSCALEKEQAEGTVLQQLALISCEAIETDHRAARLAKLHQSDGSRRFALSEYGLLPRWLNAVLKADRDIFWTSRRAIETDLDCNGRKEQFLTGLAVQDTPVTDETVEQMEAKSLTYDAQVALALAADPSVGRPDILVLRVPVRSNLEENELGLCSDKIAVTLQDKDGVEPDPQSACVPQEIIVTTPSRTDCAPIILGLDEDGKPVRLSKSDATN